MKKYKSYSLIFAIGVFTILIILRDIFLLSIPGSVISLWFVFSLLCLSYSDMMKALFYLMPFANGVPGFTVSLSLILLLLKSRKINRWQIFPVVIITALELLNIMFYDFVVNYNSVLSYIGFLAVFFYLLFNKDERVDKRACIMFFCYGVTFSLPIVYYPIISANGIQAIVLGEARAGRFMGYEDSDLALNHMVMNANTIAYYSIVSLSILLWARKKMNFNKILYTISIIVSVLSGVCSFSRTWLFLTAVIIALYVINSRYRIIFVLIIFVGFFVIFSTQNFIVQSVSNVFQTRLKEDNIETGGLRTVIFENYNEKWSSDLNLVVFGTGAVNSIKRLNMPISMHNGLQQIWVSHGIIGMLVFLLAFVQYMKKYRIKALPFVSYLPFISCFIFDQSIQFLVPYQFMLPFIPVAYILTLKDVTCIEKNV